MSERRAHARQLFAPLGPTYRPGRRTLLVRTGSALARARWGAHPGRRRHRARCRDRDRPRGGATTRRGTSRDRARPEPRHARGRAAEIRGRVELVEASATDIAFPDACFDHLTSSPTSSATSTILRPRSTELARVVRPGGTIASLEFHVPRGVWRPLWDAYVGVGLPAAGRLDLAQLVRRRPLPRAVDPRLLRMLGRSSGSSSSGGRLEIADVRARTMSPRWRSRDLGGCAHEASVLRPPVRRLA